MELLKQYEDRLATIKRVKETESEAADPIRWAQITTKQQECEMFINDLRAVAECLTEEPATLPINSVMGRFSDADVRNIVLDMQNAAMHAHSHNLNRFETRIELQKVKKKWGL